MTGDALHSREDLLEENRRLRRTMRDMVALSTLPAVWTGLGPEGIVRSLADVLLSALSLDLIYIRLARESDEGAVEVFRSRHPDDMADVETVRESVAPLLEADQADPSATIADPFGAGSLRVAVTRFGVGEDHGVLVSGSRSAGFPTERDRVLLGVGANQTAVVIQRRRVEERLRQSDSRKSAILETAIDCVITMDHQGKVVEFNPAAERTFGYRRAEVVGRELAECIIPASLRERHRRSLARYLATGKGSVIGKRVELTAVGANGREFPIELAVARIPTDGAPLFTAYLRDISERTRNERRRNVRLIVPQLLAGAATVSEAAAALLRAICEGLGWEAGFFWKRQAGGDALQYLESWHGPGVSLSLFEAENRQRTFRRGEGLPGEAWARGEPVWLPNVDEASNFPRAAVAAEEGLRGALALPLRAGRKTLGVIELFSRRISEPDPDLLETISTVADLVGQFLDRKHSEEVLLQSEARFRGLMEQAPFSMQVFAPDGRTLQVNRAFEELFGVSAEQIAPYNILRDRQLEDKGALRYIRQGFAGQATSIPAIQYNPNDTVPGVTQHADPSRWLSAVIYPLKDSAGQVREVVLVHEDITARKRLEEELHVRVKELAEAGRQKEELLASLRESEQKLRLMADTIPQLAWMARPDGHIFWFNRRWYEYTGTAPEQTEGWRWQSVHDPDVLPRVLERWKGSIASGEPFDMVFPLKGADGAFRPFLTRVNPLRDEQGKILYWFGTNTDISDIKRMEEVLRETDRRKDEFLATLAHELRNPLAPIRNSLQILKMPTVDAATAQQTREVMERQVHHLVRLVDDLLDVSRAMRGKIELRKERVELATVIARAVETAQPLIEVQEHDLEISLPPESLLLDADPVRLSQVIANLLTNAAKYTESRGRISVSAQREGNEVHLRVNDDGIGIAPEVLPHIFDVFVQVDHATTRSQGGLGIGLTLVKNLVEMHGGTVKAHSAGLGKGSEFVIRLPLLIREQPEQDAEGDGQRQPAVASSGHRFLVVDDNEDAARSLATLLRLQGHQVRVAHDGRSALDAVKSFRPALILLDLGMPRMDGYEVARRIRKDPKSESILLAALTGWGQEEDRRRTAEAGFDYHLVKPLQPATLESLLADVQRKHGRQARQESR